MVVFRYRLTCIDIDSNINYNLSLSVTNATMGTCAIIMKGTLNYYLADLW